MRSDRNNGKLKHVGVIVLNWNGTGDTLNCLASLSGIKCNGLCLRIVVIDNGSAVDPGNEIKPNFPDIDYVRLNTNIGYAAGCNLGAKRALADGADFILFLNNDTTVSSDFLDALVKVFDLTPS